MKPDPQRDEDVMAQVAQGRSAALETLIRRHANRLLTFIRRMIGDHHRSEELFQEVFLTVWTKRGQYEFPRPFRSWLYTIAVNRCRADHRTRSLPVQPLGAGADCDPLSLEGSPADGLMAGETAESITRAVLRLPPQQRAVVTLRIWDDLSYSRIAAIVGCSEGTVRSHMHLALGSLRKDLERAAMAGDLRITPGD